MGSRRNLILVGLIIIGVALIAGVLLLRGRGGGPGPEETPVPEIPTVKLLVAANNLPRGLSIAPEHVVLMDWPVTSAPPNYYTDPTQVIGYFVRADIPQGTPLTPSMLAPSAEALGAVGSPIALQVPEGMRAVAIPIDVLGAVAWSIQPGDHVDVMASWTLQELDDNFMSELPNQWAALQCGEGQLCQGTYGRVELLPTGQAIMVFPQEGGMQSRYIAQLTIQNALILGIGTYQETVGTPVAAQPTPTEGGATGGGILAPPSAGQAPPAEATPMPTLQPVQAVILVVSPQDALVLKALVELQANIDLALRRPGDDVIISTDSVSQDYIIARYGFVIPPKLPYAVGAPKENPLEKQFLIQQTSQTTTGE
mgnify:CR=1 FL=1